MTNNPENQNNQRLVCENIRCRWVGVESEALKAPNPFNPGDFLVACPKCREQTLHTCCDEPGCNAPASCGSVTKDSYRWTCWKHRPWIDP